MNADLWFRTVHRYPAVSPPTRAPVLDANVKATVSSDLVFLVKAQKMIYGIKGLQLYGRMSFRSTPFFLKKSEGNIRISFILKSTDQEL